MPAAIPMLRESDERLNLASKAHKDHPGMDKFIDEPYTLAFPGLRVNPMIWGSLLSKGRKLGTSFRLSDVHPTFSTLSAICNPPLNPTLSVLFSFCRF